MIRCDCDKQRIDWMLKTKYRKQTYGINGKVAGLVVKDLIYGRIDPEGIVFMDMNLNYNWNYEIRYYLMTCEHPFKHIIKEGAKQLSFSEELQKDKHFIKENKR